MSIASFTLAHSIAAPTPKITEPMAIALGLPTEFAKWPPKKDEIAAGIRIVETTRPWTVEESCPNVCANCGIVVIGPIVPVSSPKSAPPSDVKIAACTYFGTWYLLRAMIEDFQQLPKELELGMPQERMAIKFIYAVFLSLFYRRYIILASRHVRDSIFFPIQKLSGGLGRFVEALCGSKVE
jgi:hypothetical protein